MVEELIKHIVLSLVENKEAVQISSVDEGDDIVVRVLVDEKDMGRTIGKNGKIASSIRTIVKSATSRMEKRYIVKIDAREEE